MVWREQYINTPKTERELAPIAQHLRLFRYEEPARLNAIDIKEAIQRTLETMGNLWGNISGVLVSGSVNLAWQSQTYPRLPHNLDIALYLPALTGEKIAHIIKQAKEEDFFLFERNPLGSYRWLPGKKYPKHEIIMPVSTNQFITGIRSRDRNWGLYRVNKEGNALEQESLETRIRMFPHYQTPEGKIISSEDGLEINPAYLTDDLLFRTSLGKEVYGVNIEYLKQIQETMLRHWRWKRNPKHLSDLKRIIKHKIARRKPAISS